MAENHSTAASGGGQDPRLIQLGPTLYIGLGGTGMEVILRIRRRILGAVWGTDKPTRIDILSEFPVAQFIHFDLDQGAKAESDKAQLSDPLAERVKLLDDDKLIDPFEIETYSRSNDDLSKYPHIECWSPLTPTKIRQLGIDPSKGAGQIRAISRLYFFDKYLKIRDRIQNKLKSLQAGLSNVTQLDALGLKLDHTNFRIVIIGSVAGGTGAGTFLDMGYLARHVAKGAVDSANVDLMLFLPTGYQGANKERTEANGYASLIELETCMRGGSHYVTRWENSDPLELDDLPYRDVYLIDSGNLAHQHLKSSDQRQVYDMVADTLFEDFASVDFANKKRSVAVNQQQYKIHLFSPPVPGNRFGDMRLFYSRAYSSFGQAILDTQGGIRRDIRTCQWAKGMIEAFFGVSGNKSGNRATDKQRDIFMAAQMYLAPLSVTDLPEFSAREAKASRGEFVDYQLTEELLKSRSDSLVADIKRRVDDQIDSIAGQFKHDEWGTQVRDLVKQLEHDVMRGQSIAAEVAEDQIARKGKALFKEITTRLREQLYANLDDKEYGGLEYVLSLVEMLKDRIENGNTGLSATLAANAKRYAALRDDLRTHEYKRLSDNLEQTKGGFSLFGNKDDQARRILEQLREVIGDYLAFHLRAKAADQASELLLQISQWLGERHELDARGDAQWTGLVGELQKGRSDVLAMLEFIDRKIELLWDDTKRDHVAYIRIDDREENTPLPAAQRLREWAEEVFRDLGASRQLFPKLAKPEEREKLIGLLRRKADKQVSLSANQHPEQKDPLVKALDDMGPVRRQQCFEKLLARAMPWIDAKWNDFKLNADQFKCYIGVSTPADYKHLELEIRAQIPASVGINPNVVEFVTTGIPGRMVCYCELSGVPLTVLRGMEAWRDSYRRESEKIPLHTHRDPTLFSHPLAPSTAELGRLADEFHQYLLAVMLGVLVRDTDTQAIPPDPYLFTVSPGDARRMGNERAFRLHGLPAAYKQTIFKAVDDKIGNLSGLHVCALAALAWFYATEVYTPPLVAIERGAEVEVKGFASAIAMEVYVKLRSRAVGKGLMATELDSIIERSGERMEQWTRVVENSNADAYPWEVRPAEKPRLKRTARAEFFLAGWLENVLGEFARPTPAAGVAPPPLPAAPAQPQYQYYLAVNGQQNGPYPFSHLQQWITARQLDVTVLGWREGLGQWLPLGQIPELAPLFAAAATPPPPPWSGMPPTPPPL